MTGDDASIVIVVDDDDAVRNALRRLLTASGFTVVAFGSAGEFLQAPRPDRPACLVLDQRMPELTGLEVQASLSAAGDALGVVFITGHGDVPTTVRAMQAGAVDFLTKPVDADALTAAVTRAIERSARAREEQRERDSFSGRVAQLTPRERQVCALVIEGLLNKQIAAELGATEKTIKVHRARAMQKLQVGSVAELARIAERTSLLGRPDAFTPRR